MRIDVQSRNASPDFVKQFIPENAHVVAQSHLMCMNLSKKLQRRLHFVASREYLQGLSNSVVIIYGESRHIPRFDEISDILMGLRNVTLIHISD